MLRIVITIAIVVSASLAPAQELSFYSGEDVLDSASGGCPCNNPRPDGHAPIGVMGDHIHAAGEIMFSYRFMRMNMKGSRDGTSRKSVSEVHAQYMVAPLEMTMDMHMFGGMYSVSDDLTFMVMVPYLQNIMSHRMRMSGLEFTTSSQGLGDIKVSGIQSLARWDEQSLHLNLGLSLPTGSISEKDSTPMNSNATLPYPMQLGSGTVGFLPGITYLGKHEDGPGEPRQAGPSRSERTGMIIPWETDTT